MTSGVRRVVAALPRGGELDDATWRRRHRLLLATLAVHVPAVVLVGLITDHSLLRIIVDVVPLLVAIVIAAFARGRTAPSLVVVLGLVWSSAVLIDLSGGASESRLHVFVLLALVALYEDWRPFALAVGLIVVGFVTAAAVAPDAIYAAERAVGDPWPWTALHLSFFLLAAAAFVTFWGFHEREQRRAREYWEQLYQGERAVVAQLRQAEQLKDELVAIVSHEFRTPLTSILGFASTLRVRFDDLDRVQAQTCARAIERQTKRLSSLVSNLLAANGEIEVDRDAVTELRGVAQEVVLQVAEFAPSAPRLIHVDVPAGLDVGMSPSSLRLVLLNLLDNGLKFALPHTSVRVTARSRDQVVAVEVENAGGQIVDEDRERIFEPFVQADSSDIRAHGGLGLGLHVVRKVVAAYGGEVEVRNAADGVVFVAHLPAAAVPASAPSGTGSGLAPVVRVDGPLVEESPSGANEVLDIGPLRAVADIERTA